MRTSDKGIDFIKAKEGFRALAYRDSVGVLTIGFGHTQGVEEGQTITEDDADALLRAELVKYELAVERYVRCDMTQNEYDALVSLAYNIGINHFSQSSVVRFLNSGDRPRAAAAFSMWNKGTVNGRLTVIPGLAERRKQEAELFLTA